MKRITMSFAASMEYKPEHPERTARKSLGYAVIFQIWPNRSAMAKSIRMQESREPRRADWKACVPLSDGEGY